MPACKVRCVTAYRVSITAEPGDGADTGAQVSIRVETDGGVTRIVEMTVRSSAGGGLSLQQLPQVDLAAVGRALVAGGGLAGAGSPAPPAIRQQTRRSDRAYRKMPDAAELMAAFAEVGSVTGLAERYGVPRHTAQGWIGRARKRSE
jgi:hypothetical protein